MTTVLITAARLAALVTVVLAATGCAARGDRFARKFVKPGEPSIQMGDSAQVEGGSSVQEFTSKLRELQSRATTSKVSLLPSIEARDPRLAAALLYLAAGATAESHRQVAAAYRNAGVLDFAYRHYQRALRLEPCDSAAHEGLAQIWRDWRMPALGLGDAHRAIYCRPQSASAYNTLGTLLESLGQRANARAAFEFALRLDGAAVYALNNLCYLSLQDGNGEAAQSACERALALEPGMTAARTNLALARALQGDVRDAELRLMDGPDAAVGHYNVGVLRMSLGRYGDAAAAFELAREARPSLWEAARRAAQARRLARMEKEP